MNKLIKNTLLLTFCIIHLALDAQFSCGTKDKDYDKWIEDIGRPELNPDYLGARAIINIPIHYHIVSRSNGFGGYPLNYLYFIHCDMNYHFEKSKINIRFYIDTISYIKSDNYFDIQKPEDETLMGLYNTLNHCNIYLVNNPNGACGYVTDFPTMNSPASRSGIFMQASAEKFDCSNPGNKTLPHEMGHWLDLRHTFFKWEGQTYPPNLAQHPKTEWESVDRTGALANCLTKGDGFCDTDPDYVANRWKCPYSGTSLSDGNGKTILMNKVGRNFMSYSDDDCSDTFSPLQGKRMEAAMANYTDRKDLLLLSVPVFPEITNFTYFYPKQLASPNARYSRKNFQLRFNKLAGTTKYLVTMGKSTTTSISTTYDFLPTDLLVDTLISDTFLNIPIIKLGAALNNTFFYWKVRAVNKMSACGDNVIANQAFRLRDVNLNFVGVNPKCFGEKNGQLLIQDSTGVATNTYVYNGTNVSGKQIDNVGAGMHTLEVKLQDGTSVYFDTKLSEPTKITASTTFPASFAATVSAQGGTSPYTYNWSNGKTGGNQTGLAAGSYVVTITDKNGCKLEEYSVKINANGTGGSSITSADLEEVLIVPTQIKYGELLTISNLKNPVKMEVYDLGGKMLKNLYVSTSASIIWDIKAAGFYLVKLVNEKGFEKTMKIEVLN
ncbi:MAG: T9SS type A sorting domain-containing protein [Chitinophagales bacterium]|jgi:hypothetical protein|nr:T9SS type A sorting domain-containing protein [Sphingobacteriales bacterium]